MLWLLSLWKKVQYVLQSKQIDSPNPPPTKLVWIKEVLLYLQWNMHRCTLYWKLEFRFRADSFTPQRTPFFSLAKINKSLCFKTYEKNISSHLQWWTLLRCCGTRSVVLPDTGPKPTLTNKSSLTTGSPLERDKSVYGVTDLNVFRQTAIRALDSVSIISNVVRKCYQTLCSVSS